MTDDHDKPRRPGSFADDNQRALIGEKHRKTPAGGVSTNHGIPVEVDPEATLPPLAAPLAARVDSYDLLAQPTREAVEALDSDVQKLKLQQFELRHSTERLDRLELLIERQGKRADERVDKLIDGLMKTHAIVDDVLRPMFGRLDSQVSGLAENAQRNKARTENFWDTEWPRVNETIEAIAPELAALKMLYVTLSASVTGLTGQVTGLRSEFGGVAALANNVDRRVAVLEQQVGTQGGESRENTKRLVALENINRDAEVTQKANRWWLAKIIGAVGSVIGIAAVAAKYVIDWLKQH